MEMTQEPEAIFFDFDGVILESSNIKTLAFVELFKHLPEDNQVAIHDYHINNMGISRYKKFEWIYAQLLKKEISEEESKQLGNSFSNLVFEKILKCPFVPGAQQLLKWAKANSLSFVASGTPEEELREIVNKRDLEPYFQEVLGTPASKVEIVEAMISKYKLDRSKCWFIGDASSDYRAAKQTNLSFIARDTTEYSDFWRDKKGITIVDDLSAIIPEDYCK